ncbi:MAG: hypothetical protein HY313_04465 [Acidobacteria bacterium]|nr:hypothetical protein [Acidobacteriota bacterium]
MALRGFPVVTATEFARLHSIFLSILGNELGSFPPVPEAVEEIMNRQGDAAATPIPDEMGAWLDLLDMAISPQRLRNYGQRQRLEEPAIVSLLRYWVAKAPHTPADRDKVDWLATYLFRMREEESNRPTGWAKSELLEILKGIPSPSLSQNTQLALAELPSLIQDITDLQTLNQITDTHLLAKGRTLKKQVGEEYFHPTVLAAIVNYNLMLGKRFEELMKQALDQTHSLRASQELRETFSEEELVWDDYHTATHALQQLSDLSRAKPLETESPAVIQETALDPHLMRLGIDSTREASKLQGRIKELASHLRANPAITSIRICGKPLSLEDWESQSFQSLSWQRESGLRGEIIEAISRAIGFILRIEEELYAYQNKKSLGDQWRKHLDSLFYLLCEGLRHKANLLRLSLIARKSKSPEMAQHLTLTAKKLETSLAKVSDLF